MSLYALNLAQIISTVLGKLTLVANIVPLLEPESGAKRPKLAAHKYDSSGIYTAIYQTITVLAHLRC